MQKRLLLPLATLSLFVGLMTACDSTSSNSPTISSPIVAKDASGNTIDAGSTLTAGSTGHLTGTVTDVASWIWVVENASGTPVDTLVPSHSPAGSGDTKLGTGSDVLISFTPTAKWGPTGAYTIIGTLTGTGGGTTTTPAITFNAVPGGTSGTNLTLISTLTAAGQGVSNTGSFISIGDGQVYKATAALATVSTVDLVVTSDVNNSSQTNFESIYAGVQDNSLGNSSWGTGRHTIVKDVGTTAPTTLSGAQSALSGVTAETAAIINGHAYVVKTTEGVYGVLQVTNTSGTGDNMTLTFSLYE